MARCFVNIAMSEKVYSVYVLESKAEAGSTEAQFALALAYFNGNGTDRSFADAARWFREAAEKGHAKAQFNLGIMYSNALGMDRDLEQAAYWTRESAQRGYAKAQYNLGVMYEKGLGVSQDIAECFKWYHLAAQQNNAMAAHACQQAVVNMTEKELAEGQRRAAEFVPLKP
jgi:TPR repeat protein